MAACSGRNEWCNVQGIIYGQPPLDAVYQVYIKRLLGQRQMHIFRKPQEETKYHWRCLQKPGATRKVLNTLVISTLIIFSFISAPLLFAIECMNKMPFAAILLVCSKENVDRSQPR